MRKLLSILLLASFAVPLLSALNALGVTAESRLPACCRRNGAHRCMASARQMLLEDGQHFITERNKCPMFPAATAPAHHQTLSFPLSTALFTKMQTQPGRLLEIEAWGRIALEGARHKRGPPAVRLS